MGLIQRRLIQGADLEPWLSSLGRVFIANMGQATTPLTFNVGYDLDQPQAWIRVPANTSIIPLRCSVVLEDAAGTDTEIINAISDNDVGNGTSDAATAGPLSLHTNGPVTSLCTARQLATADVTDPTNSRELDRWVYPFANATTDPVLKYAWTRENNTPIVEGAGSWILYIAATTTAPNGFVSMIWGEVPTTWLTN